MLANRKGGEPMRERGIDGRIKLKGILSKEKGGGGWTWPG